MLLGEGDVVSEEVIVKLVELDAVIVEAGLKDPCDDALAVELDVDVGLEVAVADDVGLDDEDGVAVALEVVEDVDVALDVMLEVEDDVDVALDVDDDVDVILEKILDDDEIDGVPDPLTVALGEDVQLGFALNDG